MMEEPAAGAGFRQAALADLLINHGGALAALLDTEMRVLIATPSMRALFAAQGDAALFQDFPGVWQNACREALGGNTSALELTQLVTPDGALKAVRANVRPFRHKDRLLGVTIDCTDETKFSSAEREMITAQETLRIATRVANCGIWRFDLESRTVWVSPEYERIMGTRMTFEELASKQPVWLFAEDLPQYRLFLQTLAGPAGCASLEHRLAHAPDTWIYAICERVRDPAVGAGVYVGMARNITERKLAELELMQATRRAGRALNDKRIMLAQLHRDLDLSTRPVVPTEVEEGPAHATGINELTTRFLALTRELDARDGVISHAVRALRISRSAAQRANAAKSQFLSAMTHELRTPLNAIIGFTEISLEDAEERCDDSAKADHLRVLAAAHSLLAMVETILDLTKLEAGDFHIEVRQFDPAEVLDEAVRTMTSEAARNRNTLTVSVDELGAGIGDRSRVKQCLLQLLSNAVKFTQDGAIKVHASRAQRDGGEALVFEVRDTGPGIAPAQLQRLFEPFVLSNAAKPLGQGGAGIGLSLARALARRMGGDVVARTELGKGSIFTLTVPADLAPIENSAAA